MPTMTIVEMWIDFERRVLHPAAPAVQRREMRAAFYAGFARALGVTSEIAALPEDVAVASLDLLHQEALAFNPDQLVIVPHRDH